MSAQPLDVFDDAATIEARTEPTRRAVRRGPIGSAVVELRTAAGITVEELAARVGWARSTLVKIETGKGLPSAQLVDAIAAEFGVRSAPLHAAADEARVLRGVARHKASVQRARNRFRLPEPLADGEHYPRHPDMPATRAECVSGPRPCPWYACRHHLGVETDPKGRMRVHVQPDDLASHDGPTCALDVAEAGGLTLEEVGNIIGVTRERVRQMQVRALEKLRKRVPDLVELLQSDAPIPTDDPWRLL